MNPFVTPRTWTAGELVTKAMLDEQIRDNTAWVRAVGEAAGATGSFVSDDCYHVPGTGTSPFLAGGVSAALSGGTVAVQASTAANPGQIALATGAVATNTAGLIGPTDVVVLGTNECWFQSILAIPVLSDGSNRFTVRSGLGDSGTAESVDFVGFRYADNVNGGELQGVCRSNSSESTLDTNTAAITGFVRLGLVVNAGASLVTFYVNGTSVGTIAATIPSGVTRALTFLPAQIVKSLGTTSRSVVLDAYHYLIPLTR